jgi:hypothetical protein
MTTEVLQRRQRRPIGQAPCRAAIELHTLFARCKVNEGDSPNSRL